MLLVYFLLLVIFMKIYFIKADAVDLLHFCLFVSAYSV